MTSDLIEKTLSECERLRETVEELRETIRRRDATIVDLELKLWCAIHDRAVITGRRLERV
jgi:hypothetical protein